jgi:hypothetical protein
MVGIYYIATGSYKVYLDGFIKSLENFRIGEYKEVILLIDELIDTTRYTIPIKQFLVSDAPWPIVALLKMWYIYKYRGDYDEIYYFNANAQIITDLPLCDNKLLLTRHTHSHKNIDGHDFLNPNEDNPKSLSYIGLHEYQYVQAGFFGGKAEIVYKMCEEVSKWVESDLKRGIIPKWHDESYFNKWQTMNKNLCKIIHVWNNVKLVYNDKFISKK